MDLDVVFLGTAGSTPDGPARARGDADPARRRSHPARLRRGHAAAAAALAGRARRPRRRALQPLPRRSRARPAGPAQDLRPARPRAGARALRPVRARPTCSTIFAPIIGRLGFPLHARELGDGDEVPGDGYRLLAHSVDHRGPPWPGSCSEDERPGQFDVDEARRLGVPEGPAFGELQRGGPVTAAGRLGRDARRRASGRRAAGARSSSAATRGPARPCAVRRWAPICSCTRRASPPRTSSARARRATRRPPRPPSWRAASEVKLLALTHLGARATPRTIKDEARAVFAAHGRAARFRYHRAPAAGARSAASCGAGARIRRRRRPHDPRTGDDRRRRRRRRGRLDPAHARRGRHQRRGSRARRASSAERRTTGRAACSSSPSSSARRRRRCSTRTTPTTTTDGADDDGTPPAIFDRMAERYDELRASEEQLAAQFEFTVAEGLGAATRLLDVGCGTGLARRGGRRAPGRARPGASTPPSRCSRRRASGACAGAAFKHAQADDLPFREGWFDAVTMRLVVHTLGDRRPRALAEARRVLAPEGRLFIWTFAPSTSPATTCARTCPTCRRSTSRASRRPRCSRAS